jgi:hypothetical protein
MAEEGEEERGVAGLEVRVGSKQDKHAITDSEQYC